MRGRSLLLGVAALAILCCAPAVGAQSAAARLVYRVGPLEGTDANTVDMDKVVDWASRRINTGWLKRYGVRKVDAATIEVTVPGGKPETVARVRQALERPGTLEFRILANRHDHKDLIGRAEKASGPAVTDDKGKRMAWWVPVLAQEQAAMEKDEDIATRKRKEKDQEGLEALVVQDELNVDGRYLASASAKIDGRGRPCLEFALDDRGAKLFGELTGRNLPGKIPRRNLPDKKTDFSRRLGIILDGRLHSAPHIQSTIFGRGQITGSFTKQEVEDLAATLQAGAAPARLEPVEPSKGPAKP